MPRGASISPRSEVGPLGQGGKAPGPPVPRSFLPEERPWLWPAGGEGESGLLEARGGDRPKTQEPEATTSVCRRSPSCLTLRPAAGRV